MVAFSPSPGTYEVRAVDGAVSFARIPDPTDISGDMRYVVTAVTGRNPLELQDPTWLSPLSVELANRQPRRQGNSYPLAFERIAQLFDHPCAPDLCVLHTAAHRPTSHRGEHGSLDVVQSRAPLVAAGPGIARRGLVDGWCRVVDVAPTILSLLGAQPGVGTGPTGQSNGEVRLARQDGRVIFPLLDPATGVPDHVVVILMDGANANVLYHAAVDGTMPNVGWLVDHGTALAHGAIASLPTVTLANHTSLHTGCHPGHHGVLHNAWFDRATGRQVVTESPATWQESMQWLFSGVETIHESVHRLRPGALTVSINEPADRGSDYSTMELMRRGQVRRLMEGMPDPLPLADERWMAESEEFRWGSLVDASALRQATSIWGGDHLGVKYPLPTFTWVSFSVTDAAFHHGGPHSEIAQAALKDTDARLGHLIAAVDRRGVLDRTTFFLVADHGMEETAEHCPGDWGVALAAAGVAHRDEASGFIYLEGPGTASGPV